MYNIQSQNNPFDLINHISLNTVSIIDMMLHVTHASSLCFNRYVVSLVEIGMFGFNFVWYFGIVTAVFCSQYKCTACKKKWIIYNLKVPQITGKPTHIPHRQTVSKYYRHIWDYNKR